MILLSINKKLKIPAFKQIFTQLIKLVENGTLVEGDKLPSTRKLAENLGVHRSTVYRAYEELWSAGYIESNIGGYSQIRKRVGVVNNNVEDNSNAFQWEQCFSEASKQVAAVVTKLPATNNDVLDFRALSPDKSLMPIHNFRISMNQVLKNKGHELLDYGNAQGYLPLRQQLVKQLGEHGINTDVNQVMLSNGIQNGLELILRGLFNPGDTIFIERPSYPRGISLMNFLGLNIVEIPMLNDGIDLEYLEKQLLEHKPKALYCIPTFHNPMGISTSHVHREKLLQLCNTYQVPLIEDGFEEEMKYFGKAVLPIKAMDKNGLVIYLGTYSKVLFPGVRIGWIVASESLINELLKIKVTTELSGISLTQAAIHQFGENGYYELHKKKLHRVYRKRMMITLQACREFLPANMISYTKPEGGYLLWFTLSNSNFTEDKLIAMLLEKGVAVTPGSSHYASNTQKVQFRFSIAHRNEHDIRKAIEIIGEVLNSLNENIYDAFD